MLAESKKWFEKGISKEQNDNDTRGAIICYKQALRINLEHYPSIYNLAVCFEKMGWLTATTKWLKRLIDVNPTFQKAYRPLCLTYLKLGKYVEACKIAEEGYTLIIRTHAWRNFRRGWNKIKKGTWSNKIKPDEVEENNLLYLKALSYKLCKKTKKANIIYNQHMRAYSFEENIDMASTIMGILMLPSLSNRRMICNQLENILEFMTLLGNSQQ